MPGKTKESSEKATVLKGPEAEDAVLKYLKKMNRPYGAVDVCANLKGAVPKATTAKILATLSEKGDITQKMYGKSAFYVAKQTTLEDMPEEKLAALEAEHKVINETNTELTADVKAASAELAKLKNTPTNDELSQKITETNASIAKNIAYLTPLRAGTALVSPEETAQLDVDWIKWRAEWVSRRKKFMELWYLISDSLPPQEANNLAEDLGIEFDSVEHTDVERSDLCLVASKRR